MATSPTTSKSFKISWLSSSSQRALCPQKSRRSMFMMFMTKLHLTSHTLATNHGPKLKLFLTNLTRALWFLMWAAEMGNTWESTNNSIWWVLTALLAYSRLQMKNQRNTNCSQLTACIFPLDQRFVMLLFR